MNQILLEYKIEKYTQKLKNSSSPAQANIYQAKLRQYHQLNQHGGADAVEMTSYNQPQATEVTNNLKALESKMKENCPESQTKIAELNKQIKTLSDEQKTAINELNTKHTDEINELKKGSKNVSELNNQIAATKKELDEKTLEITKLTKQLEVQRDIGGDNTKLKEELKVCEVALTALTIKLKDCASTDELDKVKKELTTKTNELKKLTEEMSLSKDSQLKSLNDCVKDVNQYQNDFNEINTFVKDLIAKNPCDKEAIKDFAELKNNLEK